MKDRTIIRGGPAGLNATLILGRAKKSIPVLETFLHYSDNYLQFKEREVKLAITSGSLNDLHWL